MLPAVNAEAMQVFLDHVAASRPPDAHVVMVLDGAGWHLSRALAVPATITLLVLPPYSPELSPVERVWLYLRERFLSLRLLPSIGAGAWGPQTPGKRRASGFASPALPRGRHPPAPRRRPHAPPPPRR